MARAVGRPDDRRWAPAQGGRPKLTRRPRLHLWRQGEQGIVGPIAGEEVEVGAEEIDRPRVGDHGHDRHAAFAARALQDVDLQGALQDSAHGL